MKLYTEEQVNTMLRRARLHNQDDTEMFTNEYLIADETPIELPSDEEIEEASPIVNINSHDYYFGHKDGFIEGAEWVIEQIKQEDNGK
jgi:hypothetical protein